MGSELVDLHRLEVIPQESDVSFSQISAEQSIEGSLLILWDTNGEADPAPIYYLTLPTGEQVQLALTPEIRKDFQPFATSLHNLTINGTWNSDRSLFQVQSYVPAAYIEEDPALTDNSVQGWTIDGSKITGNTPWVTVLCKFPDIPDEPFDLTYYQDMYGSDYPELNQYWLEASNNAINLYGSTVAGWYTLPQPSTSPEYTTGATIGLVRDDCLAAADADVDYSQFYGVNLMFNYNIWTSFAWGGCGTYQLEGVTRHLGITTTFPGNGGGIANVVHEMGHGYCLPHSFVNEGDEPYSNAWDVMSSSYSNTHPTWGYTPQHTIALNKNNLGWIDETKVLTTQVPFHQTITLARTALPPTEGYRMVKIMLDEYTYYTLETRQTSIPYDSQLPATGVIMHKYNATTDKTSLLTINNAGSWFTEAYWTVGETYVDPEYGLSFTIIAATETGFVIDLSLDEMTPFTGCSAQTSIPVSECETLVSLYNELNGPNWIGPRGWLIHPDPCLWTGVTCTDGRVAELYLRTEELTGALPASIGSLVSLKSLVVIGNLTGSIPPELGNLSQLEELDFRGNQLTGQIPPVLGNLSNLTSLDLYGNRLTGSIPTELGNLNLLEWFRISENLLTGNLPAELGNMTSLISLIVDNNPLYGPIPMTLTQLTAMWSFNFSNTNLCEPDDQAYWDWVAIMPDTNYSNDGVVCIPGMQLYLPLMIK